MYHKKVRELCITVFHTIDNRPYLLGFLTERSTMELTPVDLENKEEIKRAIAHWIETKKPHKVFLDFALADRKNFPADFTGTIVPGQPKGTTIHIAALWWLQKEIGRVRKTEN